MKIHLLSGFLGSGKTTAIQQAARILLRQYKKIGVIVNDQGEELVDAGFFKSLGLPRRQVVNGCFCCNYNELDHGISSLLQNAGTDVIFAESVGSCTDIVATILKPLRIYRKDADVTISVFADARLLSVLLRGDLQMFEDSVKYVYFKQLEEAGIMVVTKIDLMNGDDLDALKAMMKERYRDKKIIYQNSLDIVSVHQWLNVLELASDGLTPPSLDIDYDIYGEGEARLAWLDQEVEIQAPDANAVAIELVSSIHNRIQEKELLIGHLKFLLNGDIKISFTAAMDAPAGTHIEPAPASVATLLINARVQTGPGLLTDIITEVMNEVKLRLHAVIKIISHSAFQPGYPRPTHRIA